MNTLVNTPLTRNSEEPVFPPPTARSHRVKGRLAPNPAIRRAHSRGLAQGKKAGILDHGEPEEPQPCLSGSLGEGTPTMRQRVSTGVPTNLVLIACMTVLIRLGYPPPSHGSWASLADAIAGTVVVTAFFRVPAALIERYLTRRGRRMRIYVSHIVGGVLAAIVIFAVRSQQYHGRLLFPEGLASSRAVAAVLIFYLILSLICLLLLAWFPTFRGSHTGRLAPEDRRPTPPYAPVPMPGQPQQPIWPRRPLPDPDVADPEREPVGRHGDAVRSTPGVIVEAIGVSSSLAGLVLSFDPHHLGKAYLAGLVGTLSVIIVFIIEKSERA